MVIRRTNRRNGNVLPLTAISIVALLGLVALAVDIGMVAIARNQCQNAADAAATAGARTLNGDEANNYNFNAVPTAAVQAAVDNKVLGATINGNPSTDWTDPGANPKSHLFVSGDVQVEIGSYVYLYNDSDPSSEGFELQIPRNDELEPYTAVRVTLTANSKYYFGSVFGLSLFETGATATAVHRPRDIIIIMDLSGSMRFQSLPAGPYYWSRSFSMNPESVFPKFGHYSDVSTAALQGTKSYKTGSGEYYDPANLTVETDSGPPIAEFWFQNELGESPGPSNRAFQRAPDDYATNPGGDNYLKTSKNQGSSYAKTVQDIVGSDEEEIYNFHVYGYDHYVGKGNFKGYTEGPGYWGKTFFIWPPDPRGADPSKDPNNPADQLDNGAKDWRQRFFLKRDVNTNQLYWLDQNPVYFVGTGSIPHIPDNWASQVKVNENGTYRTYNYRINYAAILKWLDTDPKPFPPRLRAGRIRYYDAFPNYNDPELNQRWWTTPTNSLQDLNERFWKGYIDFVLGVRWSDNANAYTISTGDYWWQGTFLWGTIGNGYPYTWGSAQLTEKPQPKSPYDNIRYWFGDWNSQGQTWEVMKNVNTAPSTGDYVKLNGRIYKITAVHPNNNSYVKNYGAAAIQLDRPWETAPSDGDSGGFYSKSGGYPEPYMSYTDNPRRPRHQLWFGPMTMIDYLGNYNTNQFWWPGNVPEAQAWQCKVGIQTAIDDIKKNHPNDFVGMTFFSNPRYSNSDTNGQHNLPVVPLGRNYQQLKDSLWFPPSTVNSGVAEITPWDSDFSQVPRAKGGTAPGMGFMIAYNQLSSATALRFYAEPVATYRGLLGGLGRKGASRIIIFETDGAPNTRAYRDLESAGGEWYYPIRVKVPSDLSDPQNVEWPQGGWYSNEDVYNIVKQIVAMDTDNPPGYSTARKKVKVYCIGYGTLFDPANANDPDQAEALEFFQTIQYYGNTASTTNGADFPQTQLIYGDSKQRVNRIRDAIATMLQGGAQVSIYR